MKSSDAERGVLLAQAKRNLGKMFRATERSKVKDGCDAASCQRGGWFEVGSFCEHGACSDVPGIEVDMVTARKILDAIGPIIDAELTALGIEP